MIITVCTLFITNLPTSLYYKRQSDPEFMKLSFHAITVEHNSIQGVST